MTRRVIPSQKLPDFVCDDVAVQRFINEELRKHVAEVYQQFTHMLHAQFSGVLELTSFISPTQIAANTDNWEPTGLADTFAIRATTDASRNLTGIVAQHPGRVLYLTNVGAQDLVLIHDATSTAENRFLLPNSANLTLNPNDSITLWYDTTSSRWRPIGVAA